MVEYSTEPGNVNLIDLDDLGMIDPFEPKSAKHARVTAAKDAKPQPYRGVIARFPRAILEIARCSERGTIKRGIPLDDVSFATDPRSRTRYTEALCRHLIGEALEGVDNSDPDDEDQQHDVQAAWDALARLEARLVQEEENGND